MTASRKWIAFGVAAMLVGAACASSTDAAATFRVVILPDTQCYTEQPRTNNPYSAQTQWIKNHAAADNTQFVIHMGDIVQDLGRTNSEWVIADDAHDILEGTSNPVPYSMLPGNHDILGYYAAPNYVRDATNYNSWFGPARFAGESWYGGCQGTGNNSNNYCFFTGAGMDFMVLSLEFMPTDETLTWANGIVQAHPNHRVILATHWYLEENGSRSTANIYGPGYAGQMHFSGNSGEDIWDDLVHDNPNIFMVLCGHVPGDEAFHVGVNTTGNDVFEIMSNYQQKPNGGDGWLRTLDFDAENDTITVRSYSPTLGQHDLCGNDPYILGYDMDVIPEPSSFVLLGSLVLLIGAFVLLTIWWRFVRRPVGGGLGQP